LLAPIFLCKKTIVRSAASHFFTKPAVLQEP